MAAHDMIRRAGEILKHAVGVLLLVWRRVLYAIGIGGAIAFLLAEAAGCLLTHSFPPPILTHAVALLFAFAVAWGAAVTLFIEELLTGLLDTVHFLEGHMEAGARAAAIIAERDAGEVGRGLSRLLGHRRPRQSPAARLAPVPPPAAVSASAPTEADITRADIAATEEFAITAPRMAVGARPVPAGRLPRIEWANAPLSPPAPGASEPPADPAPEPLDEIPPLPLRPRSTPPEHRPLPAVLPIDDASAAESSDDPGGDPNEDPSAHETSPSAPAASGDATDAAPTAPATPANAAGSSATRPLDDPFSERGIWSRISQALVGNVPPPPNVSGSAGFQSEK